MLTLLFNRCVAIGGEYRPLCTDDPGSDTLLPVDDDAWNNGVSFGDTIMYFYAY